MMSSNKSRWSQIQNTYTRYTNEILPEEGDLLAATSIDAWKTLDQEETGKVIADVLLSRSGDVIVNYHDQLARYDTAAQEIIQKTVAELRELYIHRTNDQIVAPIGAHPSIQNASLELPPEILDLWTTCLGKTPPELSSLFGAIDENPELRFDFGNDFTGYITLWIPDEDNQKTSLLLDLFHGATPAVKGLLLSDRTHLEGEYLFETEEYGTLSMTVQSAPEKTRIGHTFEFRTDTASPDLAAYNHQQCTVLNTLQPLIEYEPLAIGELMYYVRFADGTERQVFDSELFPLEKEQTLDSRISNAVIRNHNNKQQHQPAKLHPDLQSPKR